MSKRDITSIQLIGKYDINQSLGSTLLLFEHPARVNDTVNIRVDDE